MTTPFATAVDLSTRLQREFDGTELAQVEALLEDASAYLREVIGWQVYPTTEVELRVPRSSGYHLALLGAPISAVTGVTVGGVTVDETAFTIEDAGLYAPSGWRGDVVISYTVGYAEPPEDLKAWACVLAAGVLATAESLGTIGPGHTRSITTGPFSRSWTANESSAAFELPDRVQDRLRSRYGAGGVFVTAGLMRGR